jgi:hypothetical protein
MGVVIPGKDYVSLTLVDWAMQQLLPHFRRGVFGLGWSDRYFLFFTGYGGAVAQQDTNRVSQVILLKS